MERIDLKRKKILNMIIYFTKNLYVTKTKLMKLLFYSDSKHFQQTGRSITGLIYEAWEYGPVPRSLFNELNNLPEDLADSINITQQDKGVKITNKKDVNLSFFTKREKKILEEILFIFKNSDSELISQASHFYNGPWEKTKSQKGLNAEIDYLLSIDSNSPLSKEEIKEKIKEEMDSDSFFNSI